MLTPDMKLVIIIIQVGPLRNLAKSNGINIDPINMEAVINNVFHEASFFSFSVLLWRFSLMRKG